MSGKLIVSIRHLTPKEQEEASSLPDVQVVEYKNALGYVKASRQLAASPLPDATNIYHHYNDEAWTRTWETLGSERESLRIIDTGAHDSMLKKSYLKAYLKTGPERVAKNQGKS
jgi:hypothetical protein